VLPPRAPRKPACKSRTSHPRRARAPEIDRPAVASADDMVARESGPAPSPRKHTYTRQQRARSGDARDMATYLPRDLLPLCHSEWEEFKKDKTGKCFYDLDAVDYEYRYFVLNLISTRN